MSKANVNTTVKKVTKKAIQTLEKGKNYVSKNPTTVLKVAGVSVGVYVLYKIGVSVAGFFDKDQTDNTRETALDIDRDKLTISNENANNWAATLFEAMKIAHDTDEAAIDKVFETITAEDFKLIYEEFGTPHYDSFYGGAPVDSFLGDLDVLTGFVQKRDLVFWLKNEVSPTWDYSLYKKIEKTISAAGLIF